MYIASACLLGINCRYDGGSKCSEKLMKIAAEGKVLPVCPEQLGGLPTPRSRCEISIGDGAGVLDGKCRVITKERVDVTGNFIKGAVETLKLAKACGAQKAILKSKSPSCGYGRIYDGTFSGALADGNGVTAEYLIRNGIEVITEADFDVNAAFPCGSGSGSKP